jgi:uncharacterized phiE125 gp8 family phage protein
VADGEAVLPLAAAKAHLRVDGEWEDDLIAALRDTAVAAVEAYTMRPLSPRSFEWSGEFPAVASGADARIVLGQAMVRSVEAVLYLNGAGISTDFSAGDCRVVHGRSVVPAVGKAWPSDVADALAPVSISFTAGYDPADSVPGYRPPAALIAAAQLMLGHLYMNREAVVVGVTSTALPMGFRDLCAPWRDPVI